MEYLLFTLVGGTGGIVRLLVSAKGLIPLPKVEWVNGSKQLNLGFLAPFLIGAGAGFIAPYSLGVDSAVAFMAGYMGSDLIENLVERNLKRGLDNRKKNNCA